LSRGLEIGVLAYLQDGGRTCLIRKDKPGHYMHGFCVAPGGKRLPNESPEQAAARETEEETGLRPLDLRPKGMLHFPDYGDSPFGCEWLCFVYVFTRYEGEPLERGPEGEVFFPRIEELPDLPMYEGDHLFTPHVFRPGFFSARLVYRGTQLVLEEISAWE